MGKPGLLKGGASLGKLGLELPPYGQDDDVRSEGQELGLDACYLNMNTLV